MMLRCWHDSSFFVTTNLIPVYFTIRVTDPRVSRFHLTEQLKTRRFFFPQPMLLIKLAPLVILFTQLCVDLVVGCLI